MSLKYRGIEYNKTETTEATETETASNGTPNTPAELVKQQTSSKELALTILSQLDPQEHCDILRVLSKHLYDWHVGGAMNEMEKENTDTRALALWVRDTERVQNICALAADL